MIVGMHVMVYSSAAGKSRAFFKNVLRLKSVDAGGGWLIFALPPAELAAHPDKKGGRLELYLMCDDIEKTVASWTKKGVRFTRPISNRAWGRLTSFDLPGVGDFWLYQPKHPSPIRKKRRRATRPRKP